MIKVKPLVTKAKAPVTKVRGRKRKYRNNAERQKAYRLRKQAKLDAAFLAETVNADG